MQSHSEDGWLRANDVGVVMRSANDVDVGSGKLEDAIRGSQIHLSAFSPFPLAEQ